MLTTDITVKLLGITVYNKLSFELRLSKKFAKNFTSFQDFQLTFHKK